MRSWVGIEVGKVIKNVSCVVMSVRVSAMCCGSVQLVELLHIVAVEPGVCDFITYPPVISVCTFLALVVLLNHYITN